MNYRHAYHAGNFADVLKHATLALVIDHLKLKPAPFRVMDTHAGPGVYDLGAVEPNKTGEWREGIARLLAARRPDDVERVLRPYLDALTDHGRADPLQLYPGSPLLAQRMLRREDRLAVNELHPDDAASLAELLADDRHVKVSTLDGWTALKALLPPRERRGVLLIDPPFEQPGEWERMVSGLREALRRFATGVVMLWYPIKSPEAVTAFRSQVAQSCARPTLDAELMLRPPSAEGPLSGTGLMIVNPPHTLHDNLAVLLPYMATCLGQPGLARGSVSWLVDETTARAAGSYKNN